MRETLEERIEKADSLLDVLLILREKIMLDTHVATLAYVEDVILERTNENKYGIIKCKPFPLLEEQEPYSIQAYYFKEDNTFEIGDIILVVFTDLNFIGNLKTVDTKPRETQDVIYHSTKYGIVINTM